MLVSRIELGCCRRTMGVLSYFLIENEMWAPGQLPHAPLVLWSGSAGVSRQVQAPLLV